jgi:type II secretory pathway pseudopilin PulG
MIASVRKLGFTLVELLIVMGIIMLLSAILFPAISGARKSAMATKAQSDIKVLHSAIQSFRNEYDRYPLHGTQYGAGSDIDYDNARLTATLLANNDSDNPREIPFLKINEASLDEDGRFVDPWKLDGERWGQPYEAMVDADFDGEIDVSINKGDVSISTVTNAAIAVWTLGDPEDDKIGPFTTWGGEFVERD